MGSVNHKFHPSARKSLRSLAKWNRIARLADFFKAGISI
jgi:hypothetical protein